VGLSLQMVLPPGLAKEHEMPQPEFLRNETPAVKPVSGYKRSPKVELSHKDHKRGRGLKGKEVIH